MNKSDKEKQSRLRQDDLDIRTNDTFNAVEESRITFREVIRAPLTQLKGRKEDLKRKENDDIGISESTLGFSVSSLKADDADNDDKKVAATVKRKRRSPLIPWKKSKGMPKRPLSAYNLYYKAERGNILARLRSEGEAVIDPVELPEMDMDESEQSRNLGTSSESSKKKGTAKKKSGVGFKGLTKAIAEKWNDLSEERKIPYNENAATEKERYNAEMVVWRAKEKLRKNSLQTDPINPSDDPLLGAVVASLDQVGKPYKVDHQQKHQGSGFSQSFLARRGMDDSIMMPLQRSPNLRPAVARGIGGASYPEDWFETDSTTSAEVFLGRDTNLSTSIGVAGSVDLAGFDPEPDYGRLEYPSHDATGSRQMRLIQQHRQQQHQHQHQFQQLPHIAPQRRTMFEGTQERPVGNRSSTKRGVSELQGSNEIQREFLLQQEEALFPSRRGQSAHRPSISEDQFQGATQGRIGSIPPTLRHQQIPFVGDDDRSPLTPFFGLPLEQQLADPTFERSYMQSVMMRSTQQSTEIEAFSQRGSPRRRIQRDTGSTAGSQYRGNDNFPFQQRNSALRPHRSASLPTIDSHPSARRLEYFTRGAEEPRRYSDAGNFGRPRMGASDDEYFFLGMNPHPQHLPTSGSHLSTTMSSIMNENWIATGNSRDEHEGRVVEGAQYQQGLDVSGRAHPQARQIITNDGTFDPALHRLSQNLDDETIDFLTSIHKGRPEK